MPPTVTDPADFLLGKTLADQYRIRSILGRGGMGVVYSAVDEVLGRDVAVKVIRTGNFPLEVQDTLRARFRREAKAAARLHHPNVISVFSFGSDRELVLDFLVMELLHGRDLAVELKESGPPPLARALEILSGALRGVAAGHRAGLVHRDIKPSNLFLSEEQDTGGVHVRVLDFGIAQFLVDEGTQTHLTTFGHTPLSPAYASPEQLRGDTALTPASDVFSLGATAYELFTGRAAFTPGMRADLSHGQRVKARSLRKFVPSIPPELDALISNALSSKPAERFANAGEFLRALEAVPQSLGTPSEWDASPRLRAEPTEMYPAPALIGKERPNPALESRKEKLHRRTIRDALVRQYGWDVTSRVEGVIEVRPAAPVASAADFPEEVLSVVRDMGYRPTLLSVRDPQDHLCIRFHTPETLAQSGRGGHGYTAAEERAGSSRESFTRATPEVPRRVREPARQSQPQEKDGVLIGCLGHVVMGIGGLLYVAAWIGIILGILYLVADIMATMIF